MRNRCTQFVLLWFVLLAGLNVTYAYTGKSREGQSPAGHVVKALEDSVRFNGNKFKPVELRIPRVDLQGSPRLVNAEHEQLTARELFAREARQAGLDKVPDTALRIAMAREEVLSWQYQTHYLTANPVPEVEVQSAYVALKQRAGDTEYSVRQIFVATEEEASSVIGKLDRGEKFEELAKILSRDDGSRARGGDLGWLTPLQLQSHVIAAVIALRGGEYTRMPVKGPNGWHVIFVENARPFVLPTYEQLAPQLKMDIGRRKLELHLAELRKRASNK